VDHRAKVAEYYYIKGIECFSKSQAKEILDGKTAKKML
jgi:hypothetical protein